MLTDLTKTTDGLKNTSDTLVANMRKCAAQSPPTIYDEETKACVKGFGLADINECEDKTLCNAAKREQCVSWNRPFYASSSPSLCRFSYFLCFIFVFALQIFVLQNLLRVCLPTQTACESQRMLPAGNNCGQLQVCR